MVEVTRQESLRLVQDSSVESVTTNLQDVSKPMSEIDEMRAVRQEQDAFIARLTEDNAQLTATVENLESALCRLQTRLRRYTQARLEDTDLFLFFNVFRLFMGQL